MLERCKKSALHGCAPRQGIKVGAFAFRSHEIIEGQSIAREAGAPQRARERSHDCGTQWMVIIGRGKSQQVEVARGKSRHLTQHAAHGFQPLRRHRAVDVQRHHKSNHVPVPKRDENTLPDVAGPQPFGVVIEQFWNRHVDGDASNLHRNRDGRAKRKLQPAAYAASANLWQVIHAAAQFDLTHIALWITK